MKKGFIVGGIVSIIGIILIAIGTVLGGNDVFSLQSEMTQNTYDFEPTFENISIDDENANIIVKPSNDGKIHLVVYENDDKYYDIESNKNLVIEKVNKENYLEDIFKIDLSMANPIQTEIYIPVDYQVGLIIENKNSKTSVSDLSLEHIDIESKNGAIEVVRVETLNNLDIDTRNGNVKLESVKIRDGKVSNENGNTNIDTLDSNSFEINSRNGNIGVNNLYSNTYIDIDYENGTVAMDNILFEENLTANGRNGNFTAVLAGNESDYKFDLQSENGTCKVNGVKTESKGNGARVALVRTRNGSIEIFTKS